MRRNQVLNVVDVRRGGENPHVVTGVGGVPALASSSAGQQASA